MSNPNEVKVKRYHIESEGNYHLREDNEFGALIKWYDYEALELENKLLREALEKIANDQHESFTGLSPQQEVDEMRMTANETLEGGKE